MEAATGVGIRPKAEARGRFDSANLHLNEESGHDGSSGPVTIGP